MKQQREPHRQVIVAQAAGTVLQVRLKMKDRVAELGMPRASDLAESLRDRIPFAQHQARQNSLVELLVERELACQESPIQRGQSELKIVSIETPNLFDRARAGTGTEADVPHPLDDGLDGILRLSLGLFIRESEKHIDVGVGE